jgi:isoleucyl-tRNA synthetase
MTIDYKNTVILPRTDFPMRAGLPKKEPEILQRWSDMDLYRKQREISAGREKFILHDGPPYANGHLHIGHALNKILKDVINRSQQMMGKDANYVPGWDCHGLPIEWKVEERHREAGRDKDEIEINEFRRECREFAAKWVEIQSEEFQRLGVIGDWARPYTTMAFEAEAQIAREIAKFAMSGGLFQGSKPVLWSIVERTALADAEVEYHDIKSPTIFVKFPVVRSATAQIDGAAIVIWTTTPWTIPGNRAIAMAEDANYVVVEAKAVEDGKLAVPGDKYVVAGELVERFVEGCGITDHEVLANLKGSELAGTFCAHPLRASGYDFDVPVLGGDFVTMDQGTGFVHCAPGHGEDDFRLGMAHGIEVPRTVDEDGSYYDHVPIFAGKLVLDADGNPGDANGAVIKELINANGLAGKGNLVHSYPHSWRSKAPLIFRNTTQWFISMERQDLRTTALDALAATRFVPESGRNRITSMIQDRPDWCISRQRAWGVPIPLFVEKSSGEVLRDQAVFDRIAEAFAAEGGDAWFSSPAERFLGNDYAASDYDQVRDIVDVWFDSGSSHAFVLEQREDLDWPASLYLEGSDQHRGWFHSSLLESCGTRGRAPYDAVLTHGFVMAEDGRKMSKSLGNITSPQDIVDELGADILRLWVVGSDYSEDLRSSPEIIKYQADLYRRIRNTLRFLLGNLADYSDDQRMDYNDLPELERWVLHRVWELDRMVRTSVDAFDFHTLWTALHNFCAVDLSAFYFDIRKDSLYCDAVSNPKRRACSTVLDTVFEFLTAWLAPILCFTSEEAWQTRNASNNSDGDSGDSVHLRTYPEADDVWRADDLALRWQAVRRLRRAVTGALEEARVAKDIGSSLEAAPIVWADSDSLATLKGLDFAEICITSDITLEDGTPGGDVYTLEDVPGVSVEVAKAVGKKCVRCYQFKPEVTATEAGDGGREICDRCMAAVETLDLGE